MNKLTISAIAVMAIAMASCSSEEPIGKHQVPDGTPVEVEFSALIPEAIATRAIADGTTATKLDYAVYDSKGNYLFSKPSEENIDFDGTNLTRTVKIRLVTGESYQVVFWAKSADCTAYEFDHTAKTLNITYAGTELNNSDDFDAFYVNHPVTVTAETGTQHAELRRPFAQLNIGTSDWDNIKKVDADGNFIVPKNSKVTLDEVPTVMNVLDGTIPADASLQSLTFNLAELPEEKLVTASGEYTYLSMCYLLASADGNVLDKVEMTVDNLDNGTRSYTQIPVRRNYRTNIIGNLLTTNTDWTVEIKPGFYDPDIEPLAADEESLVAAIAQGGTVTLGNDIDLTGDISLATDAEVVIDLNGKYLKIGEYCITAEDASLEVVNGNIMASPTNAGNAMIQVKGAGKLNLANVSFNSEGRRATVSAWKTAEVTMDNCSIKGGDYCISTNASNGDTPTYKISNSSFDASTPICFNVNGTLELTKCEINATMHGVMMRGGTAVIDDCDIIMTYPEDESLEDAQFMANYFANRNWATGNTVNLAGLVMGNKYAGADYQYPTNVTLKNSRVKVEGKYASLFPAVYAWANTADGLGVTFNYENCDFTGDVIYGNGGNNITVNGEPAN